MPAGKHTYNLVYPKHFNTALNLDDMEENPSLSISNFNKEGFRFLDWYCAAQCCSLQGVISKDAMKS